MKKVLSLVLVLTLVLGSFSFAFAAPSDVVGTDYEDAVERLSQLKVLTGYPDGTFKPNNTITRAEFAAAVVRVKGLESAALAAQGSTVFTDVPAGNWAAGYVNIASKLGIVKGMGDGTFAPNSPVTYEQAVTMVMRALNYEATAEARGGYPYGYLIVANENDLLDQVKGVQGLPAVRGLVAQLLDNALEIPMMIQVGVGFNSQPLWVKSGTQGTEEVNLLDDLGFTKVLRDRVIDINPDKNQIKFEKAGVVKVAEGFDFEEVYGLRLTAWLDGNNRIVVFNKVDTPKFDATTMDKAKIKLTAEGKSYVVNKDAKLYLDGELLESDAAFVADYAKLVLNSDDEIVWARGYKLPDRIVVKEVKDNVVYSFNTQNVKVKDFTIVKEGKTVKAEDLEEGDILFYNRKAEYGEVYNKEISGTIERVYNDNTFKLDSKTYTWLASAQLLEKDTLTTLTEDDLASIMGEKETIDILVDRSGKVVLLVGLTGAPDTSFVYALVTATTDQGIGYKIRNKTYYNLDILTQNGDKLNFDVLYADSKIADYTLDQWKAMVQLGKVLIVEVDEDGDLVSVEAPADVYNHPSSATAIELTDKYASKFQLQNSAVVFWSEDHTSGTPKDLTKAKVLTWEEAAEQFSKVKVGDFYANGRDNVVAIFATDTDVTTETYTGLVTLVKKQSGVSKWEVTIEVDGEAELFVSTTQPAISGTNVKPGDFVTVTVGNKTNTITGISAPYTVPGVVHAVNTVSRTITLKNASGAAGTVYNLVSGYIAYNTNNKEMNLIDLEAGDNVTLVLDQASSRFVKYVKLGTSAQGPVDGNFVAKAITGVDPVTLASGSVKGSSVAVNVYADGIAWDPSASLDGYEVVVDRTKISTDELQARSITAANYNSSTNAITFTIHFTADVFKGDTLKIEAGAITVKGLEGTTVIQSFANKAATFEVK